MEENEVWMDLGGDQIDQSLFLTNAANNINSYVNSRPWSSKRKNSFLNAYNAIMSSGVTGATNESGQWELTTANPFDPNSLSGRDQEMLGDAAHYILSQMQSVTPRSKEQQTNKPKTKFVGQTAFDNWISNNIFGGRTWDVGQDWNVLDERDVTTGKRGTAKRLAAMQNYLTRFAETVTDDNFDFEGTPFKNAEDVKARINNAVAALNGKTEVDQSVVDTLNALGLNSRQWFDNGLGEASGYADTEGNPLTWGQYSKYQQELAEQKEKEAAAKLKAQQQAAYNGTLFFSRSNTSKMIGRSAKELKEKYGESGAVIAALNNYSTRRFSDLTPDELSEVHGAMKNLARTSISDEMFKNLKKSSSGKYKSVTNKNRFKVIPGVDGYIWDSAENQVIQVQSRQGYNDSRLETDLFKGVQTDTEREEAYKNTPRGKGITLTAADKRDIAATVSDLVAIVSPEVFSGTAAGLTAAGLRSTNLDWKNHFWESVGIGAMDFGTGALAGLPFLGDAVATSKVIKGLSRLLKVGAFWNAVKSSPEALKAAEKIKNGDFKQLTPEDYRNLFNVAQGLLTGRSHIRGHMAERRVLQHTGHNVSNSKLQRYGITRTEVKDQIEAPTLKTNKGNVELTPKEKADLETKFKSNKDRTAAVKEYAEANPEFKAKLKGVEDSDFKVSQSSSMLNKARNYMDWSRKTSDSFGTTSKQAQQGTNDFESWLQNRSTWNRIKYGTDSNLRRIAERVGTPKITSSEPEENIKPVETPTSKATPITDRKVYREYQQLLNSASHTSPKLSRKYGLNDNGFGNRGMLENGESSINIFGQDIKFNVGGSAKNRTLEIDFGGEKSSFIFNKKGDNNRALRQEIVKTIKKAEAKALQNNYKLTKGELKKTREALLELRHTGKLKQGGQINKPVNQIISEFLNKQK